MLIRAVTNGATASAGERRNGVVELRGRETERADVEMLADDQVCRGRNRTGGQEARRDDGTTPGDRL
jgi:hypothetical protein